MAGHRFPGTARPWRTEHGRASSHVDPPRFSAHAMPSLFVRFAPVVLLLCSNVFMTFAWYGHLKYRTAPLLLAICASWGIAFFEYLLMVPANRIGSAAYSAPQLKGLQEVITLLVFAGFSTWYLDQPLKWNHWAGFGLIVIAGWLIFKE